MDLPLAITLSELAAPLGKAWPFWIAGLLAGLVLILAGQPSRRRRLIGAVVLALLPLTNCALAVWAHHNCGLDNLEATICRAAGASSVLSAFALFVGIWIAAFWGVHQAWLARHLGR